MKTEPSFHTRREFLRSTLLTGAVGWTVPAFLSRAFDAMQAEAAESPIQVSTGRDATILVVLQMAGGNDGLNTVVPYANDDYARARPRLALSGKTVLKLNDQFGFHPGLGGFQELYDEGHLAIVQGVGYPNPNRSHFRSTEIWQTASDAQTFEKYGWLGRYFDHACNGCDPTLGINIGRQLPQAFAARRPIGVSLDNPKSYRFQTAGESEDGAKEETEAAYRKLNQPDAVLEMQEPNSGGSIGAIPGAAAYAGSPLDFLERTALDAQVSSDQILAITGRVKNQATYPVGQLASSLRLVARLIGGGLPTRVFYVSQGGYDTHANQAGVQDRLLRELGDSIRAFTQDLKAQGHLDRVLLMTFSEFGRRVAENASAGTDHGAASPLFIVGNKLRAPWFGQPPSLAPADLLNGDLRHTTDFRSVFAGVLEHWLQARSEPILGKRFEPLRCV